MSLVKTDDKSLMRDTGNMALVQTDLKAKDDYISKKKIINENKALRSKLEKMENDIETLKNLMMGRN